MGKRVGLYKLKEKIGKGTFGTVYLGRHMPSKNKVAIKMISRKHLSPEQQVRLDQEILCQRSVASPHIVKLIDFQKTENNIYLVLEYCAGGDLAVFLQEHGPVEEPLAQRWMKQLAESFKILRSKNIIHRDLKLQNILMTENSVQAQLKLADFGMSRFLEDTLAQSWLGTPLYMAPEVFRGLEGYDSKADVWSLGIVFYQILTGNSPFLAKRREEIPFAQKHLRPLPQGLSSLCEELVKKMLAYEPKERISFEEFFEDLFIREEEPELPVLPHREDCLSEDFVLLETEESAEDFVFVAQEARAEINLVEVSQVVEGHIEMAVCVAKLAQKLKTHHDLVGGYSIYVKACSVLKDTLKYIEDLVEKHRLDEPGLLEQHAKIRHMLFQYLEQAEALSKEVEGKFAAQDATRLSLPYSKEGLANSLICQYAFKICKEAAYDEYIKTYESCKEKYQEAVVLLEYLCKNKNYHSPDWQAIETFRTETHRRLDTVNVKLTTQ